MQRQVGATLLRKVVYGRGKPVSGLAYSLSPPDTYSILFKTQYTTIYTRISANLLYPLYCRLDIVIGKPSLYYPHLPS